MDDYLVHFRVRLNERRARPAILGVAPRPEYNQVDPVNEPNLYSTIVPNCPDAELAPRMGAIRFEKHFGDEYETFKWETIGAVSDSGVATGSGASDSAGDKPKRRKRKGVTSDADAQGSE